MQCEFCGRSVLTHDVCCPRNYEKKDQKAAMAAFYLGYKSARQGFDIASGFCAGPKSCWMLGFRQGACDLETLDSALEDSSAC